MIQHAAPILSPAIRTVSLPIGAGSEGGGFALSLAGFLDARAADVGDAIALPDGGAGRHDDADGGNALPVDDDIAVRADVALAWLAPPALGVAIPPRPIAFGASPADKPAIAPTDIVAAAPPTALPVSAMPPVTATPSPPAIGDDRLAAPVPFRDDPALPVAVEPEARVIGAATQGNPVADLRAAPIPRLPSSFDAPPPTITAPAFTTPLPAAIFLPEKQGQDVSKRSPIDAPIVSPPPIAIRPPAAPPASSVAQVFADAVRVVAVQEEPAGANRRTDESAIFPIASAPLESHSHAVAATGDTQQAPLDLRQERWTHTIIDRIERLRDGIDAADTRIRLIPDALGTIDVSVRKEGDTVHVHFVAEQAATRTLLQDAQPRLAEIAESRGLKLGQTAVGGGGGDANRQPQQPYQPSSSRPAPLRNEATTDSDDTRIA